MKKGGRLHKLHAWLNACERCGLSAEDAAKQYCLTDGEIAERKAWRDEAEKAAGAFERMAHGRIRQPA